MQNHSVQGMHRQKAEFLQRKDLSEVMELFCKCFWQDAYYRELFPEESLRAEAFRGSFRETIEYCIGQGSSLGVWEGGRLIGFCICFPYQRLRDHDPYRFQRIFSLEEAVLPYEKALHGTIAALPGEVMYCLSIAVDPDFRRRGVASSVLEGILERNPSCVFAADVSNEEALDLYRKHNFAIQLLDDGYYLAIRKPLPFF